MWRGQASCPGYKSNSNAWRKNSVTLRRVSGRIGRVGWGRQGIELNHSHEREGSRESGRDRVKKPGWTLGENLRPSHLIMADKEWLEVAVQRMLDIWLSDVPGWLRLLEIYFLYCTEIFSSCIPHGLPLCSFLKRCQLGLSFFFFFLQKVSPVCEYSWASVFSFFNNLSFCSFQWLWRPFPVMLLEWEILPL